MATASAIDQGPGGRVGRPGGGTAASHHVHPTNIFDSIVTQAAANEKLPPLFLKKNYPRPCTTAFLFFSFTRTHWQSRTH